MSSGTNPAHTATPPSDAIPDSSAAADSPPSSISLAPFVPYSNLSRHSVSSLSRYLNPFSVAMENVPNALNTLRSHLFHSLAASNSPLLQSFLFPAPPYSPFVPSSSASSAARSIPLRLHPRNPQVYSQDQQHSVRIDSMGDYLPVMRKIQQESPRDPFMGLNLEPSIGVQLGLFTQDEETNPEFGNPFRKRAGMMAGGAGAGAPMGGFGGGMISPGPPPPQPRNSPNESQSAPSSSDSQSSHAGSQARSADELLLLDESPSAPSNPPVRPFEPSVSNHPANQWRRKKSKRPSDRPSFGAFIEMLRIKKEMAEAQQSANSSVTDGDTAGEIDQANPNEEWKANGLSSPSSGKRKRDDADGMEQSSDPSSPRQSQVSPPSPLSDSPSRQKIPRLLDVISSGLDEGLHFSSSIVSFKAGHHEFAFYL